MLSSSHFKLREKFKESRAGVFQTFFQKNPINNCINKLSEIVTKLIAEVWYPYQNEEENICIIAVGGFGRNELHPYSDIDILILARDELNSRQQNIISAFINNLWAMDIPISHSVRTLKTCMELAAHDVTIMSNLLEARYLLGNKALFLAFTKSLARSKLWPPRKFFQAKYEEQLYRHKKFGEAPYILEPNIKNSPGGLRDLHILMWVANRHFGIRTFREFFSHGLLTPLEYKTLIKGLHFFWKVRFALHLLAGKAEDRLLFDYQLRLAENLGYKAKTYKTAVELFMKDYYCKAQMHREFNDILLQHFRELYQEHSTSSPPPITTLNERFQLRNNYIELTTPNLFQKDPSTLLEIFLLMSSHAEIQGISSSTLRSLRQHRTLIDKNFRHNPKNTALFMQFLQQVNYTTLQLQRMNRYGILGRYILEFGRINGQMQYDLFHAYTVDQHTLYVIRNIRRFQLPAYRGQFPLCADIIATLSKLELLYIAALFHDIGKGQGGDHSEKGGNYVSAFAKRHHLSLNEKKLLAWLVKNHLLMSMTAQRKDISDPLTIRDFSAKVKNQTYLDHLYLLTVADICATNSNLWNSWKDALLRDLYFATKEVLNSQNKTSNEYETIKAKKTRAYEYFNQDEPSFLEKIEGWWQQLPDSYFLTIPTDRLVQHTRLLVPLKNCACLVKSYYTPNLAATEFLIFAKNNSHVFAIATTLFANQGLNILEARLFALEDGGRLQSYIVLDENHQPIQDQAQRQQVENTIYYYLTDKIPKIPRLTQRRQPRHATHFPIVPQVEFTEDPSRQRTIMEVSAGDRPGLLARIALALEELPLFLHGAKIATYGERAEDIFFLTEKDNGAITNGEKLSDLRQKILLRLKS